MKKVLIFIIAAILVLTTSVACRKVVVLMPETQNATEAIERETDEESTPQSEQTPSPTLTQKPDPTETIPPEVSASPSPSPTKTTAPAPQPAPIRAPSEQTAEPTRQPTPEPTPKPTERATAEPIPEPTEQSESQKSEQPTQSEENSPEPTSGFQPIPSSSESPSSEPTTPAQTASPKPTESESQTPTSDFVSEVIRLTNIERKQAGSPALTSHSKLAQAAMVRTRELHRYFSHTRPDGTEWHTVYAEFDLNYTYAGENLAIGYRTPEDVVEAWMNSPGHRRNLLDADFDYIGVAYYDTGWTQLFASGI